MQMECGMMFRHHLVYQIHIDMLIITQMKVVVIDIDGGCRMNL